MDGTYKYPENTWCTYTYLSVTSFEYKPVRYAEWLSSRICNNKTCAVKARENMNINIID